MTFKVATFMIRPGRPIAYLRDYGPAADLVFFTVEAETGKEAKAKKLRLELERSSHGL